jgi:hypothetical protein
MMSYYYNFNLIIIDFIALIIILTFWFFSKEIYSYKKINICIKVVYKENIPYLRSFDYTFFRINNVFIVTRNADKCILR